MAAKLKCLSCGLPTSMVAELGDGRDDHFYVPICAACDSDPKAKQHAGEEAIKMVARIIDRMRLHALMTKDGPTHAA